MAQEEYEADLIKFANTEPRLLSLLYDLDLLPEQLPDRNSKEHWRMRIIIAHWWRAFDDGNKAAGAAKDMASCLRHIKMTALESRADPAITLAAIGLSACGGVGIAEKAGL